MIWNTRFNPTLNGPLHLGHLLLLMINYQEAKRSGGKFGIRFDDTQRSWNYFQGKEKTEIYRQDMITDISWLGIVPDWWESQEIIEHDVDKLIVEEFKYSPDIEHWSCDIGAEVIGAQHHFYPYTEKLTAYKVIMDNLRAVNWVIRGMDLITEDCLYRHFCTKFTIPTPRLTYISRLYCGNSSVSKTEGKYQIREFRDTGMSANNLIILLAKDCLIDPDDGWRVENIKSNPTIGKWADEVLYGVH